MKISNQERVRHFLAHPPSRRAITCLWSSRVRYKMEPEQFLLMLLDNLNYDEAYRKLRFLFGCGDKTSREILDALGYPTPQPPKWKNVRMTAEEFAALPMTIKRRYYSDAKDRRQAEAFQDLMDCEEDP